VTVCGLAFVPLVANKVDIKVFKSISVLFSRSKYTIISETFRTYLSSENVLPTVDGSLLVVSEFGV